MTYRLGADGGTRNPLGMHPPAARPWNNGCRPPPCCLGLNGTSDGGLRSPAAISVLPDAGVGAAGDTAADTTTSRRRRRRSKIMATGLDMVTWRGVRVREEAALDGLAQVAS